MIKYFIPEATDETKSKEILQRVFDDAKGLYYALSKLIHDITVEVKKEFSELIPNQVQSIAWFIAREKYSNYSNNISGGTYEREFKHLEQLFNTQKTIINQLETKFSFKDVTSIIGKGFSKSMLQKQAMTPTTTDVEEYPF